MAIKAYSVATRYKAGSRRCTTHYYACDCREAIMRQLLGEIMSEHSDPDDPNYNECDLDPCQWCIEAQALIGRTVKKSYDHV